MKPVVFADDHAWRHALPDAEWMAWVCPRASDEA